MNRLAAILLLAVVLMGCTSAAQRSTAISNSPVENLEQPPPEPTEDLFPSVPLYPTAVEHQVLADQRAFMRILDRKPGTVLAWYEARMRALGSAEVEISAPQNKVLLLAKDGKYVSIAGDRAPDGGSVIWLHLRTTKEIWEKDAHMIAQNTHHTEAHWTAMLIRDFTREDGATVYADPGGW